MQELGEVLPYPIAQAQLWHQGRRKVLAIFALTTCNWLFHTLVSILLQQFSIEHALVELSGPIGVLFLWRYPSRLHRAYLIFVLFLDGVATAVIGIYLAGVGVLDVMARGNSIMWPLVGVVVSLFGLAYVACGIVIARSPSINRYMTPLLPVEKLHYEIYQREGHWEGT